MEPKGPATKNDGIAFRSATPEDCTQLALIADMASRRLASYFWGQAAAAGQSQFEYGRYIIRNNEAHLAHFTNWRVAEYSEQFVGAINGFLLAPTSQQSGANSPIAKPMMELKQMAEGNWYVSALAILPEYQGMGYAQLLLEEAERCAALAGAATLTLLVGSFNLRAHRLYLKHGFAERERRPFIAFDGSDPVGEWILMGKSVA